MGQVEGGKPQGGTDTAQKKNTSTPTTMPPPCHPQTKCPPCTLSPPRPLGGGEELADHVVAADVEADVARDVDDLLPPLHVRRRPRLPPLDQRAAPAEEGGGVQEPLGGRGKVGLGGGRGMSRWW